MHIRSTSDILLKWEDIQNSCILPNWNDRRSIADITKLYNTYEQSLKRGIQNMMIRRHI